MAATIAVMTDTHGVLPAVEAVLQEPDVRAADLVVVTGDIAAGPQPAGVLDLLTTLGDRLLMVRGNADRDLVTIARGGEPPAGTPDIDVWAAGQLTPAHVEVLARLPHPVTVRLDGVGDVMFCHGTPRDDAEVVLADTRLSRWAEVLAGVPESVRIICCGHTHAPFVRMIGRRWVVNPGSAGMPYGPTDVPWVLLDRRGMHLRSTGIDRRCMADRLIAESSFPGIATWVQEYVLDPPSDTDAVTAFAARDGRPRGWND